MTTDRNIFILNIFNIYIKYMTKYIKIEYLTCNF